MTKGRNALWLIATLLLLVAVACGSSPTDGLEGSISLDVPDSALPEGVVASAIRSQVVNVFELSEDVQRAVGDDNIVLSVVSLEPDGVKFSEPVTFTMTVDVGVGTRAGGGSGVGGSAAAVPSKG